MNMAGEYVLIVYVTCDVDIVVSLPVPCCKGIIILMGVFWILEWG